LKNRWTPHIFKVALVTINFILKGTVADMPILKLINTLQHIWFP